MNLDIDLAEIINVVGRPTKQKYGTYYFRCPDCAASGKDTAGDNLIFNSSNGKLRCFACGHGQYTVLDRINEMRKDRKYRRPQIESKKEPPKIWYEVNKQNLYVYQCEATEELLAEPEVIEWLWNKHHISKQSIVDCGIGYDSNKNAVCFPIYSINHNVLVGFEYRLIGDKKKIWRTPQAPACLAEIYGRRAAKNMIICEGYKDAYVLKQMLEIQSKAKDYYILTPANGCQDILNHLNIINFNKYKTCYLLLDNDEAGDKATSEILEQYPFFIDKRKFLKRNEDVAEYFERKYA